MTHNVSLKGLVAPHIDSFNYAVTHGINRVIKKIPPLEIELSNNDLLTIWYENAYFNKPIKPKNNHVEEKDLRLFPNECREGSFDYVSPFFIEIAYQINDKVPKSKTFHIGDLPVMVKSVLCHLNGMEGEELIKHREEMHEVGGYFIIKGVERIIRTVQAPKRNFPLAYIRSSFQRDSNYMDKGIFLRSVRDDGSVEINTLHYQKSGNIIFSFGNPFKNYIPVILLLKALKDISDKELYSKILEGSTNPLDHDRAEIIIKQLNLKYSHLKNSLLILKFIGQYFKKQINQSQLSDEEIGREVIHRYVLVHLDSFEDKFNFLILMIQKLLKFVNNEIVEDDADSLANQEVMTSGDVYLQILKYALERHLIIARSYIRKSLRKSKSELNDEEGILKFMNKYFIKNETFERHLRYLLATGNVVTPSTYYGSQRVNLPQFSGWSVIAEKLNYSRFISHFRSIHRGAVFTETRSTDVRKLKPDAWGFICPVHTPDGAPCGLLNHLSHTCEVSYEDEDVSNLINVLTMLGMIPMRSRAFTGEYQSVVLDGKVLGKIPTNQFQQIADKLRFMKVTGMNGIPKHLEIVAIPPSIHGPFPMLALFSHPSRLMRPVKYLPTRQVEMIGCMEQLYLNIACLDSDFKQGVTTHQELDPTNILSFVATLTPFSDFNQSPRNVYQCQMAKQTMTTPVHTFKHRTDNKLYRLQTPQKPVSRTWMQDQLPFNDYASGTNAIVAVISYTGYDMEDAMIVNKASFERGFCHGSIYKTKLIDLMEEYKGETSRIFEHLDHFPVFFSNRVYDLMKRDDTIHQKQFDKDYLDLDGLPKIGTKIKKGDILYVTFNSIKQQFESHLYKDDEEATIEHVKIISNHANTRIYKVNLTVRINRNPIIGDKFSSRHGQKGVLSVLWPQEDMPFSESGMTPDIIINPNAFPSRMTIGMLLECMASKAGCVHGYFPDATPFKFTENYRAVDYFGEQLKKAGFNYYGNEMMYSGTLGVEFKADIFIGVVYYQRLRHMVSDKYQVRSIGRVDPLTKQPVHGRKKGGGIRFGEMERDALLAYGASFLVRDRLFHCSDEDSSHICSKCGSILSTVLRKSGRSMDYMCRVCNTNSHIQVISLPAVFKLLANELAAMNIQMKLKVEEVW